MGVGQPSKSTPEEVWKVEIDYVMGFAAVCREAGVRHFSLMTSVGANPRSRFAYVRLKGEQEERLKALGFARTSLFRPSMLLTSENRYGTSQAILLALWPRLHPLLAGPLRHYRGIRVEDLGTAMARNAVRSAPPGWRSSSGTISGDCSTPNRRIERRVQAGTIRSAISLPPPCFPPNRPVSRPNALKHCFSGRNNVSREKTMFQAVKQCSSRPNIVWARQTLFGRLKHCFLGKNIVSRRRTVQTGLQGIHRHTP